MKRGGAKLSQNHNGSYRGKSPLADRAKDDGGQTLSPFPHTKGLVKSQKG